MPDRIVKIRAVPGSKRVGLLEDNGEVLKVGLKSPPRQGKANEELIDFLAGHFRVKRSAVTIKSGLTSKDKVVLIKG